MEPHNDTIPANIAIIGMACRLPGADDIHQYWRNVREGVESIRTFTDDELRAVGVRQDLIDNPRYVKASAPIADVEGFDAGYFGYVARDVEVMDPQHRIFLECAVWAMEDAGYDPARYAGLIGVYGGSTINTYLLTNLVGNRRMLDIVGDHATMISNDKDYLPLRVAYKLGLRGPAYAVQTACSTSLTAVHVAAQAILSGECDMAIAGGASVRMPHGGGYLPNPTASPDGHCRTFDAGAQGSVMGNGAGIVVLKHLDDAVRDGDHVYAVIAGSAINNDGREKSTFTAPSVDGQARAAASALAAAGLSADAIDYVEAHGTATPLGDPIEVAALTKAYRLTTQRVGDCAIGSVKPNIGHLDAAAGVASLIKTVMALRHRAIPPVVHFTSPNPQIDFDASPFYVPDELVDWPAEDGRPRRAGVHSLGMGGSNAHVVLEEAPVTASTDAAPALQLLLLSAKTETALSTSMTNLAHWLREHPAESLADVAFTLQVGRAEHMHRCAVVARDTDDAASALDARGSSRVVFAQTPGPVRRTVFLMPGQGTQYVGMGADLYRTEPVYRQTIDECLELVSDDVREPLRTHLLGRRNPTSTALTDTALAQPALFIVEYALARCLESFGVRTDLLLGHSIGEYAAATVAGVFALRDALAVVCARGRLISGLPGGAMLSVPLPEEQVRTLIEGCALVENGELSIAAVNAASMVVVAGADDAVAEFEETLAAQHVPGRRLHVSHAFHSAQMDPILADFEDVLRSVPLNAPALPVVSNVTGEVLDAPTATDPGYWVEHLRRTVRFADGVDLATMEPGTVVIEVGPAGLAALVRHQISPATDATVVSLMPGAGDKTADRVALLRGLGALWQSGVRIDWEHTHDHRRRRVPLPTYPFERIRHWVDVDPGGPAITVAQPARSDDPLDWVYEPRWTQCESITAGGVVPDAVLVLLDDLGVGDRLAQRLRAAGSRVVTVRRGSGFAADGGADIVVDPARAADWDALAAELARTDFRPGAIVHGWSLDAVGGDTVGGDTVEGEAADDFDAEQVSGLYSLPHLLRLPRTPDADLLYVTRHGFDVTGEDPVRPGVATAIGLCRVIPQESDVRARVVDADPRPSTDLSLADQLFAELTADADTSPVASLAPEHDSPIALRGRRRYRQTWSRVEARGTGSDRRGGAHLVIGGLGEVGSALACHILADPGATVIVYDSAAPQSISAAQRGALADLRAAGGSRFRLVTADATDDARLREVIAQLCADHGRIAGVVYAPGMSAAAGVGTIGATELYAAHFETKVRGLRALDRATAGAPIDHCLVVGSLSSVLGGVGSGAYTAANTYLDRYVERRNRDAELPWRNVIWEHWITGGSGGAAMRDDHGCTAEQACLLYDALIGDNRTGPVAISIDDLNDRAARSRSVEQAKTQRAEPDLAVPTGNGQPRPTLSTAYVAPRDELEQRLARIWTDLLGITPIGVLDSFFELGGESLAAMQLLSRLRDDYEVDLPLGQLFKEATVALLADMIRQRPAPGPPLDPAPAAVDEPIGDPGEIERILREIEQLSDDDVERELARGTEPDL